MRQGINYVIQVGDKVLAMDYYGDIHQGEVEKVWSNGLKQYTDTPDPFFAEAGVNVRALNGKIFFAPLSLIEIYHGI